VKIDRPEAAELSVSDGQRDRSETDRDPGTEVSEPSLVDVEAERAPWAAIKPRCRPERPRGEAGVQRAVERQEDVHDARTRSGDPGPDRVGGRHARPDEQA